LPTSGPSGAAGLGSINNLGLVLRDLGDLSGARDHHQRALAISEAVLGPEHPDVAGIRNNLSFVLQALSRGAVADVVEMRVA
jgi:Tetratricopeptide repeat